MVKQTYAGRTRLTMQGIFFVEVSVSNSPPHAEEVGPESCQRKDLDEMAALFPSHDHTRETFTESLNETCSNAGSNGIDSCLRRLGGICVIHTSALDTVVSVDFTGCLSGVMAQQLPFSTPAS